MRIEYSSSGLVFSGDPIESGITFRIISLDDNCLTSSRQIMQQLVAFQRIVGSGMTVGISNLLSGFSLPFLLQRWKYLF